MIKVTIMNNDVEIEYIFSKLVRIENTHMFRAYDDRGELCPDDISVYSIVSIEPYILYAEA